MYCDKYPHWVDRIGVEQMSVFSGAPSLKPDIVIHHSGGLPVILGTEYTPACTVEADALSRLSKQLLIDGQNDEQSIALCIPADLSFTNQQNLSTLLSEATLEFCRWPDSKYYSK